MVLFLIVSHFYSWCCFRRSWFVVDDTIVPICKGQICSDASLDQWCVVCVCKSTWKCPKLSVQLHWKGRSTYIFRFPEGVPHDFISVCLSLSRSPSPLQSLSPLMLPSCPLCLTAGHPSCQCLSHRSWSEDMTESTCSCELHSGAVRSTLPYVTLSRGWSRSQRPNCCLI